LMLAIAYSCSIGGVGTLIGTPPNALMAAFMNESYNIEIGFAQWMMVGIPFVILALPLAYYLLTNILFSLKSAEELKSELINNELEQMGKLSSVEKRILFIFVLTAILWIIRPIISQYIEGISDTSIVIFTSLLLFIIPSGEKEPILQWKDAKNISWGILLLFGGGLALAMGIKKSGLAESIANFILQIEGIPIIVLIIILTASIIFITELSSNTATAAAFLPVIASVAVGLGIDPLKLVIPATIAASCAFMLPVATPPNAIVFSSNQVTIKDMTKAGIWLNLSFVVLIVIVTNLLVDIVF
ncbi:MAG: DASS family sodium-coupled anion symporter, partial [Melioribacteraceae bacterium]|nr:DASS family sodium-coupled anion symporter [Melioribacteraceae bacterium]